MLNNKEKFSINEKLEAYEKALSIFINDKKNIPIPKKRWKIKDDYIFNLK